jgi:hypothetical protein
MVSFPTSMVLSMGLKFTIGTFTWTTGVDGPAESVEAVQAPPVPTESTSTTADSISGLVSRSLPPTTHRPLPRYQGRRLDNADLIESIDQVITGLAETLTLVDSIRDRSIKNHRSRPVGYQQNGVPYSHCKNYPPRQTSGPRSTTTGPGPTLLGIKANRCSTHSWTQ